MHSRGKEKLIIKKLNSGYKRKEVALEFGYSNFQSLDRFMRRKNYVWNSERKNYYLEDREIRITINNKVPVRIQRIIELFKEENPNPREISKYLDFKDYKEMSDYMKDNNYIWSSEDKNYIYEQPKIKLRKVKVENKIEEILNEVEEGTEEETKVKKLFESVLENFDILEELVYSRTQGYMMKHLLPGVDTVKSVRIISSLNELMKEFSKVKNVSQKHIIEVALIEFLRKYGFKKEVEYLLKSF